jgi:hypothetical protein
MSSRCLSAGGIRFLDHPFPAAEFGLPCGRLTGRMSFARRHSIRPHRGYYVPHPREPTGLGVPFTAGAWCPISRRRRTDRRSQLSLAAELPLLRHHRFSRLRRPIANAASSGIHSHSPVRSSPCPVPPCSAGSYVRLHPSLHTPPLPATHGRIGEGALDTSPEILFTR